MANSLRDELFLLLAGLFGGSLYFITENTALEITQASNVSLLVCTTPVFTQLLSRLFYKEKFRRFFLPGTVIALTGVALIVCNGNETLEFNLSGDLLTLAAAVSWALYCMVLRRLGSAYPTLFITRKVFSMASCRCRFISPSVRKSFISGFFCGRKSIPTCFFWD